MQPFTLFDFSNGLNESRESWLIPDKSFTVFEDGYIDLGALRARDGYNQFANGGEGGVPECESRIVAKIKNEATGASGATLTSHTCTKLPLRRGTVTVSNSSASVTDDGLGAFSGGGTVDYTTGVLANVVIGGSGTIVVTYDYHPGSPVMMIANYISNSNARQLLVADKQFLNLYNSVTNRFDEKNRELTIIAGTKGSPTAIQTSVAHKLIDGQQVLFYGLDGTTSLNGQVLTVTVTAADTFTVPPDTSSDPGNPTVGLPTRS